MDIVLIGIGTYTLVNVIIAELIRVDLVSQIVFYQGVVTTIITQAKVLPYCDQHLEDDFILLAKEIFGCLH
jgi:hypothetical protein